MKPKKQPPNQQPISQQTYLKLLSVYKRKCQNYGIVINLTLKQILDLAVENLKLDFIKIKDNIGPVHVRAFMQSFIDTKYCKLKSIQIWKSKISDEGLRHICKYIQLKDNIIDILDIIDNQITNLGCQFLGKLFVSPITRIKILKLDDNIIGNKGIQNLTIGLRTNPYLTKLSLKYCGIDQNGVKFIQEILANIHTKIRSIKLQGNTLKNQGIYQLLRVVDANQMLEKINIADTGLNLLDFVAKNLYVLDQNYVIPQQEGEVQQQDQDNPEKRQSNTPASNLSNVKQVILPATQKKLQVVPTNLQKNAKVTVLKQLPQKQKKEHYKISKLINQSDKSLSGNIVRLLTNIMRQNMLIRKYDLRFNPISQDAAIILFQVIQQNPQIKDVEINNNVDNTLRENLDTLMRKRTGRMPKGRVGRGNKKKK